MLTGNDDAFFTLVTYKTLFYRRGIETSTNQE